MCGRPISFPEPTCLLVSTKARRSGARFSNLPIITALVKLRVSDESFKRFENCTVKLSAKETKWTSLEVRTHATFLETSISKYDFGPVKLPGLSRNGPLDQLPETKILGLPSSRRTRGFVYMASRDKVDVDTLHKDIQYGIGKSEFGFESTTVSNFKSKRHQGPGNELVDYFKAPCLGADQKDVGSGNEIGCRLFERT